ncbi:hypothetical protein SEA_CHISANAKITSUNE_71 [Gordonia phage ChisanaKitsune]|uniref:Uncharacterized protein n=1 Tax=Gordonia phage ChisanaKitsune TaxID=2871538 RepID=A0AAE8C1B2_9CAUD|nr:hypothetical protein PQD15_gp071 [Gordonia phage ChisanaKitsune]QZE10887.1 hypothetical protein SEA_CHISANAKITSUNE_71 [Gordonia phage ChisanaKitsune]
MPYIVTMGKRASGHTMWSDVEPVSSNSKGRRAILDYLRSFVYPGSGWTFVCVYPKQGPGWRVRRIVHDNGEYMECVLVDRYQRRRNRHYDDIDARRAYPADLSE